MEKNHNQHGASSGATIEHEEMLSRAFVTDAMGNLYSLYAPIPGTPRGSIVPPDGIERVYYGEAINPKYQHILSAGLILYQMAEQAKIIFEAHADTLAQLGTPMGGELSLVFEQMAANLNLSQRHAIEGAQALGDQVRK